MRWHLSLGLFVSGGLLLVPALSGTSCFVPGFELVQVTTTGTGGTSSSSSTSSAGGSGGEGGLDPCSSASFPLQPSVTDDGPNDVSFVAAFRTVDFGEDDVVMDRPGVGYDLDDECTCIEDNGPSCLVEGANRCDGYGGIDNSISVLFALAKTFSENFTSSFHSDNANRGEWGILVRVEDYNGQPNDQQVRVSLFTSGGLEQDPCVEGGTPAATPKWDGSDRWPIMTPSLEPDVGVGGGAPGGGGPYTCGDPSEPGYSFESPKFFDNLAYVNDGVLVASLPEAGLVLDGDGGAIDLTAGFLTGRLREGAGGWFIDGGVLAGRWAATDAFVAVSTLGSGTALCTDDSLYQNLKTAVCNARDITAQIAGPTAPCDAVSFGMEFTAEPAQLGFIYVPPPGPPSPCTPMTNPANDACDAD